MIIMKKTTLMMLLLAAALMAGCKKESDPENTDAVGHKNPIQAQDTAACENYLAEFETLYQVHPNADGSFYALAYGESTDYLLKLDNNGFVQHRVELGFRGCRCLTIINENIFVLGDIGMTSSPYTMYEQGYLAVFDLDLQLVATTSIKDSQYKIEAFSFLQDSQDLSLFYVAGMAIDDAYIQYPYICTLQFSEGLMTMVSNKIYSNYPKYRIIGMVEKQSAGQKDLILETIRYTEIDHPYHYNSSTVHIVKLNYFEETSGWGHNTWDLAIAGVHGDSYSKTNSIDSDGNNVYFFGFCYDDKEPAPASGGYWSSGWVVAVNWHQGQVTWQKTVSLTNYDERFYDGFLSGGYLYACGSHSGLSYSSTKKYFANGLVVKMNLSGNLVAYKTFGDVKRNSFLKHIAMDSNGNLVCVGESGENLGDYNTKWTGWFLKTDLSSNRSLDQEFDALPEVDNEMIDQDASSYSTSMDGGTGWGEL